MKWYWAAWALISFAAFAVPELIAVFTGHPDRKLSSAAWALEDLLPGDPLAWRIALMITAIIVVIHLTVGPRH